jgi:hypothetical protein
MAKQERKLEVASRTGGRRASKTKPNCPEGVRTLREAAGQAVGQNSEKIKDTLLKKKLKGDLKSAQLLFR